MFGINSDDHQSPVPDEPPVMPGPVSSDPPANDSHVNPISGNETLGPPQVSSGTPAIMAGPGSPKPPTIIKNKKMLDTPPPPPSSGLLPNPGPVADSPGAPTSPAPTPAPVVSSGDHADLLNIKQEALHNLKPLVGQLNQTPEEKFKTLMMLMRASDNADLVKEVYAAAQAITDEKARAQALLDVVNEINYFTHPEKAVEKPTDNSAI